MSISSLRGSNHGRYVCMGNSYHMEHVNQCNQYPKSVYGVMDVVQKTKPKSHSPLWRKRRRVTSTMNKVQTQQPALLNLQKNQNEGKCKHVLLLWRDWLPDWPVPQKTRYLFPSFITPSSWWGRKDINMTQWRITIKRLQRPQKTRQNKWKQWLVKVIKPKQKCQERQKEVKEKIWLSVGQVIWIWNHASMSARMNAIPRMWKIRIQSLILGQHFHCSRMQSFRDNLWYRAGFFVLIRIVVKGFWKKKEIHMYSNTSALQKRWYH